MGKRKVKMVEKGKKSREMWIGEEKDKSKGKRGEEWLK